MNSASNRGHKHQTFMKFRKYEHKYIILAFLDKQRITKTLVSVYASMCDEHADIREFCSHISTSINFHNADINCHRNFGKVFAFTHSNEKLKRKFVEESLLTYLSHNLCCSVHTNDDKSAKINRAKIFVRVN